jgi:plastocyanin
MTFTFQRREIYVTCALIVAVSFFAGLLSDLLPSAVLAGTAWHATVGAQSGDGAVQALAFLPNNMTVDAGDSITWTFPTDEVHTVTFPFANSGTLKDGQTFSTTFSTAGDFAFKCLIHPHMTGTVHVQAAGASYPHDQGFYDRTGKDEAQDLIDAGHKDVASERADTVRDRIAVIVGAAHSDDLVTIPGGGEQTYMIARFLPSKRELRSGETLTWTAGDFGTPHTVTFGASPSPSANPNPIGLTGPGEHTTLTAPYPVLGSGATVSSGFLGAFAGTQGTTFSVTFSAPGTYYYYCELHKDLGMIGAITVH